jgi:membrane protein DedA with SNARE-associated domain
METTGQHIFTFLSHYGYWAILPLMIIEGPVATVIAAMLAALGAFNVYVVFFLSVLGDMIGDAILYYLGYAHGMRFVRGFGRHMGITEKLVLQMQKYFKKHGGVTIFAVKSTTGLSWVTFVTAGIVRMDFKKFLLYSFLGGLVWSGFLVILGYFYGYLWREIRDYIQWIGWAVVAVTALSIFAITVYKRWKAKKLLEEGNGNGNNT